MRISDWSSDVCSSDLITVVLLWSWLTWWLIRWGWRLTNRTAAKRHVRAALLVSLVAAWLIASFWYGGGRIYYYDWQVRQMCAVDGGVKVYETVVLPAAKFDRYGNIGVKNERYAGALDERSEEHTSELQSLMRISYAVFCLTKKNKNKNNN